MQPQSGNVLVAATPTLHRIGLLSALRENWPALPISLTAEAEPLPALVRQRPYALLVLDSNLSGPALPQLLEQLYRIRSQQPVLVLTDAQDAPELRRPLQQFWRGAALPRGTAPGELVRTVRELLDEPGGHSFSSLAAAAAPRRAAPPTPFTPRELEVLRLAAGDCCNQEIAERLYVSVRTVESHRRALLQKTGAKTFLGLVIWAMREGWVTA